METDVVVIGTGAGGAPVALALANAGIRVIALDRGPRYSAADFVHDEVEIARRNFFVPSALTDPHIVVEGAAAPRRTDDGWVSSCVGGGTVHMSGFFYRFTSRDVIPNFHIRWELCRPPASGSRYNRGNGQSA